MKATSLSREQGERAGLLKNAGLLEVMPPDHRGFEGWRVSEAAIIAAATDGPALPRALDVQ